jgi:dCMP deaminase
MNKLNNNSKDYWTDEKQRKYDDMYLDIAKRVSEMSHCEKRKVGCVVVRSGRILSMGWNGTPKGFNNCCEDYGETRDEVIHAEENAIAKIAKSTDTSNKATVYSTLAPCIECAKLMIQAGISRVVFLKRYTYDYGVDLLRDSGMSVIDLGNAYQEQLGKGD